MIAICHFFGFGQIHLLFAETRQDNFIDAKILNIRYCFDSIKKKTACC
jgi:hypothetical protein